LLVVSFSKEKKEIVGSMAVFLFLELFRNRLR